MKKSLWKFVDNKGGFISEDAFRINSLYFPLCNNYPLMSSLSPNLHGDIKTNFNSFLLEPASRISLNNLKSSRNFWIYINPKKAWSITGASKDTEITKADKFQLEAGLLWQKISRQNKKIGLKAEITSFVPMSCEPIEIMLVEITNLSSKTIKFIPFSAIPIYARSANNLHDHRHVTSLLSRIELDKFGVIVKPTLIFDESGHKKNSTSYFVLGIDQQAQAPQYIYPTQEEFIGDDSDFEAPKAVINNILPSQKLKYQGKEPMAGLRFKLKALQPKEKFSYIVIMGITTNKNEILPIFEKFNTPQKIASTLEKTKLYWQKISSENSTQTSDKNFDNWLRWINIQPILRKIFGCSFLPDFDYGKGGRGWRDLWQDCLALILKSPSEVRLLLINNFKGVRIDGSNATVIGQAPGEFIADRNNIARVWMDHGIWPLITTHLYINQTQDLKILLEEISYFKDHQLSRGSQKDWNWKPEYGKELKTKDNRVYSGTVLEHILIQNLVQFFNVGPHNHIRLEGADWNDGLDLAKENGESVAFSAMYAQNLNSICEILEKLAVPDILLLKEMSILLDSLSSSLIDYSKINQKQKILNNYFQAVKREVSGEKISISTKKLINDLKKKADWLSEYIRKTEYLKEGFFNGYYDNDKKRVEGRINGLMRMTLTGQTFPIMSGIATTEQIKSVLKNIDKYLKDKTFAGLHLNTDFKDEQISLGRAFSFAYGDKENGAFFNHMTVMFAYALYKRGFVKEGFKTLNSIYIMANNTEQSKIYPCLPEYFNNEGRGMYSYLTGSASWYILTLLTQVFGVRGEYGDFIIEPKLTKEQFKNANLLSLSTTFAERKIKVNFLNPLKKDFDKYFIRKISFNNEIIANNTKFIRWAIKRDLFLKLAKNPVNIIEVTLA